MKVVYMVEPIDGIVEYAHDPIETRVAKERLNAFIDEILLKPGLMLSYTVTDDNSFPFPFKKPDILNMNGFFGQNPDFNQVAREIDELFEQPHREYTALELQLLNDFITATDEQILKLVEKYHYAECSKEHYDKALKKIRTSLKPWEELKNHLTAKGYDSLRGDLKRSFETIDHPSIRNLIENLEEAEESLKSGKREKVKEMIMTEFHQWARKNTRPLYNACGDAKFYGGGFWLARLVVPEGEVEISKIRYGDNFPKTAEELLQRMQPKRPCQVIMI